MCIDFALPEERYSTFTVLGETNQMLLGDTAMPWHSFEVTSDRYEESPPEQFKAKLCDIASRSEGNRITPAPDVGPELWNKLRWFLDLAPVHDWPLLETPPIARLQADDGNIDYPLTASCLYYSDARQLARDFLRIYASMFLGVNPCYSLDAEPESILDAGRCISRENEIYGRYVSLPSPGYDAFVEENRDRRRRSEEFHRRIMNLPPNPLDPKDRFWRSLDRDWCVDVAKTVTTEEIWDVLKDAADRLEATGTFVIPLGKTGVILASQVIWQAYAIIGETIRARRA